VNGVVIIATDAGIFRLSGQSPNLPPTASVSNISKLSNETVSNNSCLLEYDNRVFFVSSNGLYQLQYSNEVDELVSTPLSVEVSDWFTRYAVAAVSYSALLRAFVVGFEGTSNLLAFNLSSEAWGQFRLAIGNTLAVTKDFDGFTIRIPQPSGSSTAFLCKWTDDSTDLANIVSRSGLEAVPAPLITSWAGNRASVTEQGVDVIDSICAPAEVAESQWPGVTQAFGSAVLRSLTGTQAIVEQTDDISPLPILSYLVSKSFDGGSQIQHSRVRSVNMLLAGSGKCAFTPVLLSAYEARESSTVEALVNVGNSNAVSLPNVEQRSLVGDLCRLKLRLSGVSSQWAIAVRLEGSVELLGYQFDTGAKARRRVE
jgi:hypothetical protein